MTKLCNAFGCTTPTKDLLCMACWARTEPGLRERVQVAKNARGPHEGPSWAEWTRLHTEAIAQASERRRPQLGDAVEPTDVCAREIVRPDGSTGRVWEWEAVGAEIRADGERRARALEAGPGESVEDRCGSSYSVYDSADP